MKFPESVKRDNIPTKTEVYGEPSQLTKVDPVVKRMNDIVPFLRELYYPDLAKYLI